MKKIIEILRLDSFYLSSLISGFHCRYYNQGEVKDFEGNECEWPIFYTFLIIDGVFKSNTEQIEEYQAELRKCIYADSNGGEFS